ncbi:MAG: VOC family protein [Chitinophagales bacterium]|nr:VOC family protein [Chitinophagales bacterium]
MKKLLWTSLLITVSSVAISQTENDTTSMKLESLTPNIMVNDVNETLDYYTNVLGFNLVDTNPTSGEFEWGYVMLNSVGLMFQEEKSLKTEYPELKDLEVGGALTLYVRVENINDLFENIKDQVTIVKPMNTTFYGTNEFAIMDVNGFILTFSETPNE